MWGSEKEKKEGKGYGETGDAIGIGTDEGEGALWNDIVLVAEVLHGLTP